MASFNKIFVETTVVSLLVAPRSKNPDIARWQTYTRAWWRLRNDFQLFASTGVMTEAAVGDPKEAAKRIAVLRTMTPLPVTADAESLAKDLLARGKLPPKAKSDALHLGTAMVHKIDILLSWNFKHFVNPVILRQIYLWAADTGYNVPVVCSPESLLWSSYEQ